MLFRYKAATPEGEEKVGTLEAASAEIAVSVLQRRNLIVISLEPVEQKAALLSNISFFERVKQRDIVILSRQLSTLFEARMPVLATFQLLAAESPNPLLRKKLTQITDDIQGGAKIAEALAKHPDVFSEFYVRMVEVGEQSGKLDEVFKYLAGYLERSYELSSKALRALVYPAFVLVTFFGVIILMMTAVVPKLGAFIKEANVEVPIYTKVVLNISGFLSSYGVFLLVLIVSGVIFFWKYSRTSAGRAALSKFQLQVPYLGDLYTKIYLSRIADSLSTMISGGVSMVRALRITSGVVGNEVYEKILKETLEAVKSGSLMSQTLAGYEEIPGLMSQMIKIGEETGKLDFALRTVAKFYKMEVDNTLETIVSLLEPALVVALAVFVGLILAAIIVPIYQITTAV
jgi:type IV pilus assembly protein PilC